MNEETYPEDTTTMTDFVEGDEPVQWTEPDAEPEVDSEPANPEAPYGYKADGTPYKRRPNKGGGRRAGSGRKRKSKTDYAGVVRDLIMSIATPLGMTGLATHNDVLIAHSWVLSDRADPIANAMQGVAEQNDRIARALEKLAEVSPYAELIAAVMPAIPQLACNMGMIQPGMMGTVDPREIAAGYYRMNGQNPPPPPPAYDYDSVVADGR